jgi:hypothetical protein
VEATKRCPYCGEQILAIAIKCKHCGSDLTAPLPPTAKEPAKKPPPDPTSGRRIVGGILLGAGLLWVLTSGNHSRTTTDASSAGSSVSEQPAQVAPAAAVPSATEPPPPAAPPSPPPRPIYKTTAVDLYRLYDKNEVAADRKIGNAIVEVSGLVSSIDENFMNDPVIDLTTGDDDFNSVHLRLKKDEATKAAQLSKLDSVIVRCDKMRRTMGSPYGDDCSLVKAAHTQAGADAAEVEKAEAAVAQEEQQQLAQPASQQ